MKVIDLGPEHRNLFAVCLEDWSPEAREGGPRRAAWVERFLARGLRAKLAVDDAGTVGGMIQYLPIEQSFVDGEGLYFIPCIWVHGHRRGRGDFRGHGMGEALLAAAEADARALGAKGMAAWGLWLPFWMRARWYRRHGYRPADRQGVSALVWKPFAADARPPRWFPRGAPPPARAEPGKVTVTAYSNGWCMAANVTCARARRAAAEFGDRAVFREVDTSEPGTVARCGFSDAVFVDGKPVTAGPPPGYAKLRARIERQVRRLERRAGPTR
jgi:GNAT superfamily N-acetyltransferase